MTDSAAARTSAAAPPPTLLRAAPAQHGGPLPSLRLLRAPSSEPPYDDEATARPALRLVPAPAQRTAPPEAVPEAARTRPVPDPLPRDRRLRTPTADLPPARPFAVAFVQRLVEVCGGVRPVTQLQRETSPGLYLDLERALVRRPRPQGPRPGGRDVRSVHVQERPDGVVEVCATVRRGARVGALALRLEGVQGRWLCTQLQGV